MGGGAAKEAGGPTPTCGCVPWRGEGQGLAQPRPRKRAPPCRYSIAGTWSGWEPRQMEWDGESFGYVVTVGNNQWEAFQILLEGSWETVVYPSVKDANPQMTYAIRGPDGHNKGYNWVMGRAGFNPFKKDLIPAGTRYKVTMHVTGEGHADSVNWELFEDSKVCGGEAQRMSNEEAPVSMFIAGTWGEWNPAPMQWDGRGFSYMVRVGHKGWEAFQLCVGGSWEKVYYPSVADAHPYTHFEFRGPDNRNKGYNWVIGNSKAFWRSEQLAPGTRVRVSLFIDAAGRPKRLGWELFSGERADQRTMVCLAGLASGSLEVASNSSTYVGWCRVKELVKNPAKVFRSLSLELEDAFLKDGRQVKATRNCEGFEVRPVAGMQGIKSLSPPGSIPIPVWSDLIDALEGDYKWHAFNYDWRRWGDEKFAEECVARFRREVEAAIRQDKHRSGKATVIGHSMGCSVILYVLSVLEASWVRSHIEQVVIVAPAHMGSPSMVSSYAHCPFVDTQSWIPIPAVFDTALGDLTATWACMIAELPVHVGGVAPWDEDHVFAKTPSRSYRLRDIGRFLTDLQACKAHRETGPALWPGVQRMSGAMKAPVVKTTIIYSSSVETPVQVEYDSEDLGKAPRLTQTVPGDGTICAESVERVAQAWIKQGASVSLIKEPVKEGTSHKGLIACPFTCAIMPAVTSGCQLTPIQVTVVRGAGLKNSDGGLAGVSDPYCRFHVPGKPATRRETEVIQNDLNPEWHCTETIYAYQKGDSLTFDVFDMDLGCTDGDLLGHATMRPEQLKGDFDGSLAFENGDPGSLHVQVRHLPPM